MGLRHLFIALALALGSAAAMGAAAKERYLVLEVALADPGMKAAVRRARAELPGFFERLAHPAPDEGEFMVAYDAIPGKAEELVWIEEISRSPGSVTGTVRTETQRANVSQGDRVTIADARILDWAYRKGKVVQGSYTTRVLIAHMPRDESFFLRETLGW